MYGDALCKANDVDAFRNCRLTSLDRIIHDVNEAEAQKAETRKMNAEIIETFMRENEHRIVHDWECDTIKKRLNIHLYKDRLVSVEELEKTFVKTLTDLNFKWEVDRFLEEHSEETNDQYFDRERFYREVRDTDNYRNYRYSDYCDYTWMYPMLMMHRDRRMEEHQELLRRQEEERQAAERRRQAEELRRQQERMSSNNSSFGGGFGGGFSSGGGFKGGW